MCECHFIRDLFSRGIGLTYLPELHLLYVRYLSPCQRAYPRLLSLSFLDLFGTGACSAFC